MQFFTKRIYTSVCVAAAAFAATGLSVQAQTAHRVPPSVLRYLEVSTPSQSPGVIPTATKQQQNSVPIAQNDELERRRSTSYIGVGVNFGIDGEDTALREDNFAIVSKAGITKNLSLHNSTIIGDDTVSTFAVTFGIPIEGIDDEVLEGAFIAPFIFVGGGATFMFDEFDLNPLLTTGIDFPVSPDLTGTFRLNVGFADDTEIGLILGLGYNFNLF